MILEKYKYTCCMSARGYSATTTLSICVRVSFSSKVVVSVWFCVYITHYCQKKSNTEKLMSMWWFTQVLEGGKGPRRCFKGLLRLYFHCVPYTPTPYLTPLLSIGVADRSLTCGHSGIPQHLQSEARVAWPLLTQNWPNNFPQLYQNIYGYSTACMCHSTDYIDFLLAFQSICDSLIKSINS